MTILAKASSVQCTFLYLAGVLELLSWPDLLGILRATYLPLVLLTEIPPRALHVRYMHSRQAS